MPRAVQLKDATLHVCDEGSGPPLLLVHGFPLDHQMWQQQISYFSRSFRVIAPDLRGFGKSGELNGVWTMQQFAEDLAAVLTAMQETRPVVFCGLSMGGYIAWQFVQRYPERVAKLIVCDSLATADAPDYAQTRLTIANRLEQEGTNAFLVESMLPRLFGETLVKTAPTWVRDTEAIMRGTSPHTCAAAQRGMSQRPDMSGFLPSIQVPSLILCGEHDIISPPEKMRTIAQAISGATYVEIAQAGHMAPLEKPDEVNRAIEEFLRV